MANYAFLRPYNAAAALTKHDTNIVSQLHNKGLWSDAGGQVTLVMHDGSTVAITLAAKTITPINFKILKSTGTTPTDCIGLGWV